MHFDREENTLLTRREKKCFWYGEQYIFDEGEKFIFDRGGKYILDWPLAAHLFPFNHVALRIAKTQWSLGHSECSKVEKNPWVWTLPVLQLMLGVFLKDFKVLGMASYKIIPLLLCISSFLIPIIIIISLFILVSKTFLMWNSLYALRSMKNFRGPFNSDG